jgi:hypothetical protein
MDLIVGYVTINIKNRTFPSFKVGLNRGLVFIGLK